MKRLLLGVGVGLLASGCVRGCAEPPRQASSRRPPLPAPTEPLSPAPAKTLANQVEARLGIHLPDTRRDDGPIPGLSTLPRRRLLSFAPDRHLTVQVDSDGSFDAGPGAPAAGDDARAWLRAVAADYETRSGVAAARLILLVDADAPAARVAALRAAASQARPWRLGLLGRDAERIFEVSLDPPPATRPRGR